MKFFVFSLLCTGALLSHSVCAEELQPSQVTVEALPAKVLAEILLSDQIDPSFSQRDRDILLGAIKEAPEEIVKICLDTHHDAPMEMLSCIIWEGDE